MRFDASPPSFPSARGPKDLREAREMDDVGWVGSENMDLAKMTHMLHRAEQALRLAVARDAAGATGGRLRGNGDEGFEEEGFLERAQVLIEKLVIGANREAAQCLAVADVQASHHWLCLGERAVASLPAESLAVPALAAARLVTVNHRACWHRAKGDVQGALQTLRQAVRDAGCLQAPARQQAVIHSNLCAVLSQIGQHELALKYARAAVVHSKTALQEEAGSEPLQGRTLLGLAIACHNLAVEIEFVEGENCLRWYRQAADLARRASTGAPPEASAVSLRLDSSMASAERKWKRRRAIHERQERKERERAARKARNNKDFKNKSYQDFDFEVDGLVQGLAPTVDVPLPPAVGHPLAAVRHRSKVRQPSRPKTADAKKMECQRGEGGGESHSGRAQSETQSAGEFAQVLSRALAMHGETLAAQFLQQQPSPSSATTDQRPGRSIARRSRPRSSGGRDYRVPARPAPFKKRHPWLHADRPKSKPPQISGMSRPSPPWQPTNAPPLVDHHHENRAMSPRGRTRPPPPTMVRQHVMEFSSERDPGDYPTPQLDMDKVWLEKKDAAKDHQGAGSSPPTPSSALQETEMELLYQSAKSMALAELCANEAHRTNEESHTPTKDAEHGCFEDEFGSSVQREERRGIPDLRQSDAVIRQGVAVSDTGQGRRTSAAVREGQAGVTGRAEMQGSGAWSEQHLLQAAASTSPALTQPLNQNTEVSTIPKAGEKTAIEHSPTHEPNGASHAGLGFPVTSQIGGAQVPACAQPQISGSPGTATQKENEHTAAFLTTELQKAKPVVTAMVDEQPEYSQQAPTQVTSSSTQPIGERPTSCRIDEKLNSFAGAVEESSDAEDSDNESGTSSGSSSSSSSSSGSSSSSSGSGSSSGSSGAEGEEDADTEEEEGG